MTIITDPIPHASLVKDGQVIGTVPVPERWEECESVVYPVMVERQGLFGQLHLDVINYGGSLAVSVAGLTDAQIQALFDIGLAVRAQ